MQLKDVAVVVFLNEGCDTEGHWILLCYYHFRYCCFSPLMPSQISQVHTQVLKFDEKNSGRLQVDEAGYRKQGAVGIRNDIRIIYENAFVSEGDISLKG